MVGFIDLLKQSKIAKGDVRRELFDTITSILRPLTDTEFVSGCNYTEWYSLVRELWDKASRKTKKTKDMVVCTH